MRRLASSMMSKYIYQQPGWPNFSWDNDKLATLLADVRHRQGRLLGRMGALGFQLQSEAVLETMTVEILKSNEIEGELLNRTRVRSSLARRLGMDKVGEELQDRHIDGIVDMMLDATQKYLAPLTDERLFGWHACMFPTGRSGMYKIMVADWRKDAMQIVSGGMGYEKVHYAAPPAESVGVEMQRFLEWFNADIPLDPVIKAGIAHLWFETIHPFDDGNGRIGRAILDMQLARADGCPQRFYSLSAQLQKERKTYYDLLESSQKGRLDITPWLEWFLHCCNRALSATEDVLATVLYKAEFWERIRNASLHARQIKMLNMMLDGFEGHMTAAKWAKLAKCSHDTALRDIQSLLDLKILQKGEAGGRSTAYGLTKTKNG
jgi:Fic family protein